MIMTPQEKAEAYDKAIERIRQMIEDYKNRGLDNYYACAKESLEKIFPELAESEDERIRKDIVFYIAANHKDDGEKARWLYWLEKQGEQKPTWGEEDKCMLNNVIDTLKPLSQTTHSGYSINSMIAWLKSLKDRYAWKPSDEQIKAVRLVAEIGTENNSWALGILKNMYQDLKKLREEYL